MIQCYCKVYYRVTLCNCIHALVNIFQWYQSTTKWLIFVLRTPVCVPQGGFVVVPMRRVLDLLFSRARHHSETYPCRRLQMSVLVKCNNKIMPNKEH